MSTLSLEGNLPIEFPSGQGRLLSRVPPSAQQVPVNACGTESMEEGPDPLQRVMGDVGEKWQQQHGRVLN